MKTNLAVCTDIRTEKRFFLDKFRLHMVFHLVLVRHSAILIDSMTMVELLDRVWDLLLNDDIQLEDVEMLN